MIFVIIALLICGSDLAMKYVIEHKRKSSEKSELFDGKVVIEKSHNKGVFLNALEDKPNVVIAMSGVVIGIMIGIFSFILPKKRQYLTKLALSFCIGGAAGNFLDRFHRGYVVDYLNFPKIKKIKNIDFNISDLFIFTGSILLLLISIFKKEK